MKQVTVNRNYTELFTVFAALLSILIFLNFISYILPNIFLSILAFIIFCIYNFFILKLIPKAFVLLLFFLFFRATTLISGILIEGGGYMIEMGIDGEPTGAFIRLTIIYIIFITIVCFFLQFKWSGNSNYQSNKFYLGNTEKIAIYSFYSLISGLFIYVFFIGLKNGFPILSNIDRFVYKSTVSDFFLTQFIHARIIIAAILGFLFAISSRRLIVLGYFISMIILSILFAEKFTSIISMLIFFFIPSAILGKIDYKYLLPKAMVLLGLAFSIAIPTVLFVYGYSDDPDIAVDRLIRRATSQGQLWYIADYSIGDLFRFDWEEIKNNFLSMFSLNPDPLAKNFPYLGVRSLMADYLNSERLLSYSLFDITLTFGFEAYLLKLFGSLGLVLPLAFFAIIYAAALNYFAYAVTILSPVRIFIASRLLIWINFGLQQGDLYFIVGVKVVAFVFIAMIYEFFSKALNQKNVIYSKAVNYQTSYQ